MSILRDEPRSISHPHLVEFLTACDNVRGDGFMTVPLIQTTEIFKYSKSLFITIWDDKKKALMIKYWGSGLVNYYGQDVTGKCYTESRLGDNSQIFIGFHKEIIDKKNIGYLSGSLDWRDKVYRKWDQVTMPLMRDGDVNETLTYLVFHGG